MLKMILLMILTFSLPVTTAETPELIGKNQLSLHGGFDFQGPNGDSIDLRVGYDWFLRDDLLVGGEFQWAVVEDIAPGENDFRARQLSLVAEKLFPGMASCQPAFSVLLTAVKSSYLIFI